MNKSKIDYCDRSWNPITGCLHNCTYCYAEKIAKRFAAKTYINNKDLYTKDFKAILAAPTKSKTKSGKEKVESYPFGFLPTFHRYRLDEPIRKTKPLNIFVGSMADNFGEWVPAEWLYHIFDRCFEASQHTYLFLTKNPKRINKIIDQYSLTRKFQNIKEWDHIWFGTTITNQNDAEQRLQYINKFPEGKKFISVEPIFGSINLNLCNSAGCIDWVIIGGLTGPGSAAPNPEWVKDIIGQCRNAGIPVFLKSNLNWQQKIQEYPW